MKRLIGFMMLFMFVVALLAIGAFGADWQAVTKAILVGAGVATWVGIGIYLAAGGKG